MQCPTCYYLNTATDVRCLQCRTTLIHEALGHSEGYRKATNDLDSRVYGGIGAFFGLALVATILMTLTPQWLTNRGLYIAALIGAFAGGLIGRLVLRGKQRGM